MSCGTTCSAVYNPGTCVLLMASPDAQSDLTGWSGGDCSGTIGCPVIVSADRSVTATFTARPYSISGTVRRNGSGLAGTRVTAGLRGATSAADGTYTITGLPAGTCTVVPRDYPLDRYAYSPSSRTVTLTTLSYSGVDFSAL